jgi:hypothetical protein
VSGPPGGASLSLRTVQISLSQAKSGEKNKNYFMLTPAATSWEVLQLPLCASRSMRSGKRSKLQNEPNFIRKWLSFNNKRREIFPFHYKQILLRDNSTSKSCRSLDDDGLAWAPLAPLPRRESTQINPLIQKANQKPANADQKKKSSLDSSCEGTAFWVATFTTLATFHVVPRGSTYMDASRAPPIITRIGYAP